MLSSMRASLTVLCIYAYTVCTSDNDGAIIEPTQPTKPRCDHPLCSILEKLNLLTKSEKEKVENPKSTRADKEIIDLLCQYMLLARRYL